jgi:23S rRNA (adenine2503-C2)-methyltransferase
MLWVQVPKSMREAMIAAGVTTGRSHVVGEQASSDGTRKFLCQLHDGRVVETVGIPNDVSETDRHTRLTACISSQVGCPMRCTFCATGKGGFARNLRAHEIVDQVLTVQEQFGERVTNVGALHKMHTFLHQLFARLASHKSELWISDCL